jgi:putative transposase
MPNYRRAFVSGGTFFFTVATHQRRAFLTTPLARSCLRNSFRLVRERLPLAIEAIVLLPDHLHCVWSLPPGDSDYPDRWRQIKSLFTREYLSRGGSEAGTSLSRALHGERGIWQRRYYEHTVRDELDLKRCVDYLHLNPVKHRLVERVSNWPWSSFHRYVRLGEYSADWGGSSELFGDEWARCE